jgi:hypothetical protein
MSTANAIRKRYRLWRLRRPLIGSVWTLVCGYSAASIDEALESFYENAPLTMANDWAVTAHEEA